jgi:hypothetical protein
MSDWHDKVDLSREKYTAYEFAYLDELAVKAAIKTAREEGLIIGRAEALANKKMREEIARRDCEKFIGYFRR